MSESELDEVYTMLVPSFRWEAYSSSTKRTARPLGRMVMRIIDAGESECVVKFCCCGVDRVLLGELMASEVSVSCRMRP